MRKFFYCRITTTLVSLAKWEALGEALAPNRGLRRVWVVRGKGQLGKFIYLNLLFWILCKVVFFSFDRGIDYVKNYLINFFSIYDALFYVPLFHLMEELDNIQWASSSIVLTCTRFLILYSVSSYIPRYISSIFWLVFPLNYFFYLLSFDMIIFF